MFEGFANKFLVAFLAVLAVATTTAGRAAEPGPATTWEGVAGPERVEPGKAFTVRLRLRNTGAALWEATGDSRALVAAMVVDGNGNPWPASEARARLPYPVPPGAATTCLLTLDAPAIPGRYRLLIGRGTAGKDGRTLDGAAHAWAFEVAPAGR